ncbi:MAG: ATP-binding cassette domain-containing protein [Spirochaetales bacterium]|nr:ATP-binding cassette domain-containing protein [Spirochaetales bacterium]
MEDKNAGLEHLNLVRLMAYVIQADGKVSDQEIDFFSKYIREYYPKDVAEEVFNGFLSALKEEPVLESIIDNVNKAYGEDYRRKIVLLIKIYELFGADGITESELGLFDNICGFFSISAEDSDLIKSLLVDAYQYEYIGNVNRKISFGGDPHTFDLIYPGSNVEIFDIRENFFLVNKRSSSRVFIDEELVHDGQIVPLHGRKTLSLGDKDVRLADIHLFFRLKRNNYTKRIYFAYENGNMVKKISFSEADFRMDIDANIIRLYKNTSSGISLVINRTDVEDFSFVNLNDIVVLAGGFRIPLREIILSETRDTYALKEVTPEKNTLVISDRDQCADIYIDDMSEKPLSLTITPHRRDEAVHFTLSAEKLPYPVYLGSEEVKEGQSVSIDRDSTLTIGKNRLLFNTGTGKIVTSFVHFNRFTVDRLSYRFKNGRIGIDDVSFEAKSGELVGFMGASGAGKSTLLQLLLGYYRPSGGRVLVNGEDFFANFDRVRHYIGYVPQDDLLLENLSVYENLKYAAKIRMPEKSGREIDYLVQTVLKDIGLLDKRNLKVGSPVQKVLSGGQRKRLNIGLELLSDPDLFFLDEPTSGLSSKDSEMIISLLSSLSKKGKIVFVVIHQPGSEIYKKFDKLLLLDVGGKLAYYGDSMKAIGYFKQFFPVRDDFIECPSCGNVNPEIIFNVLEKKESGKDGLPLYREKEEWGRGVAGIFRKLFRRPKSVPVPVRRYEPDYWKQLYLSKQAAGEADANRGAGEAGEAAGGLPPAVKRPFAVKLGILLTLFRRTFAEKRKDLTNMVMTFLVPLTLGLILAFLLRGGGEPYMYFSNTQLTKYLFLSAIIFIFFGLMSSVNEVIKDRPMLIREKIVDIKPWQYLVSKAITFSLFAFLQVCLYLIPGFIILRIPVSLPPELAHLPVSNSFFYFLLMGFVTTYVSFALGLLVSSLLRSELAAFNIIPLIIIPQIIFGGMFVDFSDMGKLVNKEIPLYSNLTFARWSYEGFLSASEYLNPLYQVTDTDHIMTIKKAYERDNGGGWDSDRLIYTPLRRLSGAPAGEIPARISSDTFTGRLLEKLETEYPERAEKLASYYTEDPDNAIYRLRSGLMASEKAEIEAIFQKAGPNGFYTKYYLYEVNEAVHKELAVARTPAWLAMIKHRRTGDVSLWLRDMNIFPAHEKVWGRFTFLTIRYNVAVLLVYAVLFHLATIAILGKL